MMVEEEIMKENRKMNLFVSYCHDNKKEVDKFQKHMFPLENEGFIEINIDQKNKAGDEFLNKNNMNIENSDVFCPFISASYLASHSCKEEIKLAYKLYKARGIKIIPIILSHCAWLDDEELSKFLALPPDGKPVSSYKNKDEAWNIIYKEIKTVVDQEIYIKGLVTSPHFSEFLKSTDMLSSAHSQKEEVQLEDIFIYPELSRFDNFEFIEKVNLNSLINDFWKYSRVVIAGANQSGKTAICKKIFINFREKNLVPVYLSGPSGDHYGKISNRISKALDEQYDQIDTNRIDIKKIIPIVDDFQYFNNKTRYIKDLSEYEYQVIITDEIFNLNIEDEDLFCSYTHFKIEELNSLLRNQLIRSWSQLNDKGENTTDNDLYQIIDEKTEIVDSTLGKIFSSGIMPAYPFFILSIISTYEIFSRPLDQEITSQGYCYQAFIFMYLTKNGVKTDEMDTYFNFLTEFAFYLLDANKKELPKNEFSMFIEEYMEQYILPVDEKTLINRLVISNLLFVDSLGNYRFAYQYIYYFFAAKYLAENIEKKKRTIKRIISNLHINENAYIAIFISHHSKSDFILDEITQNAISLFKNYKPATLDKKELSFFDMQAGIIEKAILPSVTPEKERNNRLSIQINSEEEKQNGRSDYENEEDNPFRIDLRRSIKTVEVMGQIIKTRAGSLKRPILENTFREAMMVNLRILSSFFECIKNEDDQNGIISLISSRIEIVTDKKNEVRKETGKMEKQPTREEMEEIAKTIFWNVNFFIVIGIVNKIIKSIGSDQLYQIIEKVCKDIDSPVAFLIQHGILMWYSKNIQIDNIVERINENDFSVIAKEISKYLIVDHCSMHNISYKDKQRIESKLNLPKKRLLIAQARRNK